MQKIISGLAIFLSILLAASLLKGAGVGFENWYAAPEGLSQIMVIILTMAAPVRIALYLMKLAFK